MGHAADRPPAPYPARTWPRPGDGVCDEPRNFRGERRLRKDWPPGGEPDPATLDDPKFGFSPGYALLQVSSMGTESHGAAFLARAGRHRRSPRRERHQPIASRAGSETNPEDLFQLAVAPAYYRHVSGMVWASSAGLAEAGAPLRVPHVRWRDVSSLSAHAARIPQKRSPPGRNHFRNGDDARWRTLHAGRGGLPPFEDAGNCAYSTPREFNRLRPGSPLLVCTVSGAVSRLRGRHPPWRRGNSRKSACGRNSPAHSAVCVRSDGQRHTRGPARHWRMVE